VKIFCELRSLTTADLSPGDKVLIGGELLFVSLGQSLPEIEEMVSQPPRPGNFKLLGESTPIQAAVHESVFPVMRANPKVKFGLTVDWYIDYLRKQSQDIVLIGGAETSTGTNLEIFVLQKGRVTLIVDKNLPMIKSTHFEAELNVALDDILTRLQMESLPKVVWAYPLSKYESPRLGEVDYVGAERFARAPLPVIHQDGRGPSPFKAFAAPLALSCLGLLVGSAFVYFEWHRYQSLRQSFEQEISGLEVVYQDGANRLELLSKRQMLLDAEPPQKVLLDRWKHLAGAISKVQGVVVKRLSVFNAESAKTGLGGRAIDFQFELEVPPQLSVSERVQAKQLLTDLALSTGYEMWLSQGEMSSDSGEGIRRMKIEGISSGQ